MGIQKNIEGILIRMDGGTTGIVRKKVEGQISCGNTIDLETEKGPFAYFRHALFCKSKFMTEEPDLPQSNLQCVAMGGKATALAR